MPTAQEYVEQIAELAKSEKLGDEVAKGVEELEAIEAFAPTLFKDDALVYFLYDGEDIRNRQVDFLNEIRSQLEPRYDEATELGYVTTQLSMVAIDGILKKLDLLLGINRIGEIRKLIVGSFKEFYLPPTIFAAVDNWYSQSMDKAGEIGDAVLQSKLAGIDVKLIDFDNFRESLRKEIEKINHLRLRDHLKTWMLEPVNKFAGSSAFIEARNAAASKISTGFHAAWSNAKSVAEKRFEEATRATGKKLSLSVAIKFDGGLGPVLEDLEKKYTKGVDVRETRDKAVRIGTDYLKALEQLPDKLKKTNPDFYGPLRSSLMGIVASIQELS